MRIWLIRRLPSKLVAWIVQSKWPSAAVIAKRWRDAEIEIPQLRDVKRIAKRHCYFLRWIYLTILQICCCRAISALNSIGRFNFVIFNLNYSAFKSFSNFKWVQIKHFFSFSIITRTLKRGINFEAERCT